MLTSSGLAAVSIGLLAVVGAGDHLLVTASAYQPTRTLCDGLLCRMGVETTHYDPEIGGGIEALFRPNTRAVLAESPGSQAFEIQDIPAIAVVTQSRDVCFVLDNTWATPLLFPPHERAADIAIEAGTKHLSGHSGLGPEVVAVLGPEPDAGPDVEPEAAPLRLLPRHLQPLAPPDPLILSLSKDRPAWRSPTSQHRATRQ